MHNNVITLPLMAKQEKKPNRLAELRENSGKTMEEVAEKAECSRLTIWRLENGKASLTLEWMRTLAAIYGVTPGELLNPEDNPFAADEGVRDVARDYLSASEDGRRTIHAVSESVSTWREKGNILPFRREG